MLCPVCCLFPDPDPMGGIFPMHHDHSTPHKGALMLMKFSQTKFPHKELQSDKLTNRMPEIYLPFLKI